MPSLHGYSDRTVGPRHVAGYWRPYLGPWPLIPWSAAVTLAQSLTVPSHWRRCKSDSKATVYGSRELVSELACFQGVELRRLIPLVGH